MMFTGRTTGWLASIMALAAALSGCAITAPDVPATKLRQSAPIASSSDAGTPWPTAQWWERYQDPVLDDLMARGIKDAPSLTTASARVQSARDYVRVAAASGGLQATANADAQRIRLSDNGIFPPRLLGFNWYNDSDLGIGFSYTFDWWGKQRATVEAALDQAKAAAAERHAALLVLSGGIADSYFGWQADQLRIGLATDRVNTLIHEQQIAERRVAADLDRPDTVHEITESVAVARELLVQAQSSAHLHLIALAAFLGCRPDELPTLEPRPLPAPTSGLPANLTLDLIAHRPDVAASRWRVESSMHGLKAAKAEYYPDISLTGLVGLSAIRINKLLEVGSGAPALGAAVHLPLFDNHLRDANFATRRSQMTEAIAVYDEAIVAAAHDVASTMETRLALDEQRRERLRELESAEALASSASARFKAETTDIRPVLQATLAVNANQDALTQLTLAALHADIALQRALGGGYVSK